MQLPASVPSTRSPVGRWFGRTMMRLTGWRFAGTLPELPKFVIVVAPHTSNLDFLHGVFAKVALGLRVTWIGKHTLFRWPLGALFRHLGGIPVVRDSANDVVSQIADAFRSREQMVFALAPEGTRSRVEHWRSGYWHIARKAGVPIVPVGLDYATRSVVIGDPLTTGEVLEDDERALRQFFAGVRGKRPELYVP